MLLFAWTSFRSLRSWFSFLLNCLSFYKLFRDNIFFAWKVFPFTLLSYSTSVKSFLPLLERPILEFLLSLYSSLKSVLLSVRFYSYFALFGFQWTHLSSQSFLLCLVGLDGLEPSTSRLSGARSSHLSYRPLFALGFKVLVILVEMMGIEPMTPCLQGRCSPSWATPP